jgi:hypothetical protein
MFTASGLRVRFLKVSTYMEIFLFEFSFLSRKCDLCHCRCEITNNFLLTAVLWFLSRCGRKVVITQLSGFVILQRQAHMRSGAEVPSLSRSWRIVDADEGISCQEIIFFPWLYKVHTWGASFVDKCMPHLDRRVHGFSTWTVPCWSFSRGFSVSLSCPRFGY